MVGTIGTAVKSIHLLQSRKRMYSFVQLMTLLRARGVLGTVLLGCATVVPKGHLASGDIDSPPHYSTFHFVGN